MEIQNLTPFECHVDAGLCRLQVPDLQGLDINCDQDRCLVSRWSVY